MGIGSSTTSTTNINIIGVIEGIKPKEVKKETVINFDLNSNNLQDYLSKKSNDPIFNKLFEFEKQVLENQILSDEMYKKVILNGNLEFVLKDIGILNDNNSLNSHDLKEYIIKNEKTQKVMECKILDNIKTIKENNDLHKITHLTILLIGKKEIGKTTLIKYMFSDNENQKDINKIKGDNYTLYSMDNFPLQIIEFKGIGYDNSNKIEQITQNALDCIQNLTSKNKRKNSNELIHCIWYLISGVRIDPLEFNLLTKLNKIYNNKNMPIIVVYNKNLKNCASEMKTKIIKNIGNIDFVEIQPIDDKFIGENEKKFAFGGKELKEKTLQKCSQAMESDLIELMTEAISETVKKEILKENEKIVLDIYKFVEKEINNFKKVLTDEELKNYVVNLFKDSIFYFYKGYNEQISNQTLEILNKSSIIKNIENFINYYKPLFEKIIKSKLDEISKILINKQANIEKNNELNYNMRVDSKRTLNKFKETITVYYKRNYYYAAQKYIIIKTIKTVLVEFIQFFRKRLDEIVISLLNDKKNEIINDNLQKCFLTKLKNFAILNKVNIKIDDKEIILNRKNDFDKSQNFVELPPAKIRNNSIDLISEFDIDEIKENKKEKELPQLEENNWFIYKSKKWKYLTEKTALDLKQFLEKDMLYQEKFFEPKKNEIEVFKLFKEYEKHELVKFFNKNYKSFIKNKICQVYNLKYIHVNRNILNNLVFSKVFEDIYIKKLNNTIDAINSDLNFYMIKYLTIVVIGRSGVGKSTLINAIIKEDKAETGIGDKVTKVNSLYDSHFIPFLKLWDTRGIELNDEYGPNGILNNALEIINKTESNNNFNNLVSCIWYCVSDNYIDDKEIEIIKSLRKEKPFIPLIIVYSFAVSNEGFKTILNKVLKEFPNEIIIPVLAKKSGSYNSFGLDELVNKTIESCKKELIKGKFYKIMRQQLSNYIEEKIFKIEIDLIKNKVINAITKYFINNFKNVLNEEQLFNYIYNLFLNIILEYLAIDDLNQKREIIKNIKNSLKDIANIPDYLKNFINYYKMKTKELVDNIKDKMALDFIDKQVYFEKKKAMSIDKLNKCNISDFIKIIEDFLNDNFYYISQKYLIHRIITEPCTEICTSIEMNVNKLVNNLLNKNPCDFLQKIYLKKFENYENTINTFRINGKIFLDLPNNLNQTMNEIIASMKDYSSAPAAIPNL